MKSGIVKRSVVIGGHKTSISLEDAFWDMLWEIAERQGVTISAIVRDVDTKRAHGNLSSAIRLFVLEHVRTSVAGHGVLNKDMASAPPAVMEG